MKNPRWSDLYVVLIFLLCAAVIGFQYWLLQRSYAREHEMFVLANERDVQLFRQQSIAQDWELAATHYKNAAETFRQAAYFCVTPSAGGQPRFEK